MGDLWIPGLVVLIGYALSQVVVLCVVQGHTRRQEQAFDRIDGHLRAMQQHTEEAIQLIEDCKSRIKPAAAPTEAGGTGEGEP